jgi:hypothetical protein
MPELQKAVMGMDPRIKPFEALAELQTRVKREKMKQAAQAQNPQQQPVAQQALAEAASLQNPYMAGLAAAPVESPVGMAGGGIVAFQEGGDVPGFQAGVYIPQEFDNTIAGFEAGDLYAQAMAKIKAGKPLSPKEAAVVNQGAAGTKSEPPRSRNIDMPAAFDNTITGFQPGNRYAEEMAKIKAKEDEAKNRPLSGQEKALIATSAPLAAVGDLALSPVNLLRNALRNPLDRSERPSMTPLLDARERAMNTFMPNAEKTSSRSQRPEYDAATQERGTAALEAMRDIQTGSEAGASGNAAAGLAGAAAARGAGGAGRAGAGAAGVGLGATPSAYDTGFTPQTDDERIAAMQKYKKAMGAQNEEFLRPLQERLSKYESEVEEGKKGAMADALVQAGLGMLAGKSQYALQNIGEGGAAGLAALRESKKLDRAAQEKLLTAQSDMAKSRIALEKGDEQTAATLANQARQEQQAGAQFKLLGQHYANQDRAAQLQAQAYLARANAMSDKSALTPFQAGRLADMAGDNVQKFMDSSAGMQALITARAEAKNAGVPFDAMKFRSDLVQREMQRLQQTMGGATMPPQASPAGGGSGARFLGFE